MNKYLHTKNIFKIYINQHSIKQIILVENVIKNIIRSLFNILKITVISVMMNE